MRVKRWTKGATLGVALLVLGAAAAFAADLKADLLLGTSGIQQNKDLGNFLGGETKTFTIDLYVNGEGVSYPAAFSYDSVVPEWVKGVTTGSFTAGGTANKIVSTITVTAPCTLGGFGGGPDNNKLAGSSVQYTSTASGLTYSTAWVNIKGNVTDIDTAACEASSPSGPTADAGSDPSAVDEGSSVTLDGSGSTDDGTISSYLWTIDDSSGDTGITCDFDAATAASTDLTCDDDGTFEVTLEVTDNDANTDTDTVDVTFDNAAPEVDSPLDLDASDCSVDVEATYSDAGLNDSHDAVIDWGDGESDDPATLTSDGPKSGTGTVSGSHTYAGPGTYDITVTVTDDDADGDSESLLGYDNNPSVVYPVSPMDVAGKKFKTGSVIPVKIEVTGCTAGLAPTISVTGTDATTVKSAGKANLGVLMRYSALLPGYIYNWQTKGWAAGVYSVEVLGLPGSAQTAAVTLTK